MAVVSWETALTLCLFLPVLALPKGVEYARRTWGWFGGEGLDEAEALPEAPPS
jgi:hypothetical protein